MVDSEMTRATMVTPDLAQVYQYVLQLKDGKNYCSVDGKSAFTLCINNVVVVQP